MGRKKVGLALSGGSVRGLAHIGVLEVLENEGIPIDFISGTSIGALVGAVYAKGKNASVIKDEALAISKKGVASLIDLTLPKSGFFGGKRILQILRMLIGGDVEFSDLKIPLAVVAADINTGEEVVIKEGPVLDAVRASTSLPVLFTLAKWRGRYLVDGGLVNPVPVSVARSMGADFVIAVNVVPGVTDRVHAVDPRTGAYKEPGLISVITQTIYIATYSLTNICLQDADMVIRPNVSHMGFYDLHHAEECIHEGELAAEKAIPEIRKRLKLRTKGK